MKKFRFISFFLALLIVLSIFPVNFAQAAKVKKLKAPERKTVEASKKKTEQKFESPYEYGDTLFIKPEDKIKVETGKGVNFIGNDKAVGFYLDPNFKIEVRANYKLISTDYKDGRWLSNGELFIDDFGTELSQETSVLQKLDPNDPKVKGRDAFSDNIAARLDAKPGDTIEQIITYKGEYYLCKSKKVKQIQMRGDKIGWTANDIIYMVQYRDLLTNKELAKPKVTTIVIDRENSEPFAPEYYVEENGVLRAKWNPVKGADAYALVFYEKPQSLKYLEEKQAEHEKEAKEFNLNAADDESLVKKGYNFVKTDKDLLNMTSFDTIYADQSVSLVGVVNETEYKSDEGFISGSDEEKRAKKGWITSTAGHFTFSGLPDSQFYLSVVALKDGGKVKGTDVKQYRAIKESNLFDFNELAARIPQGCIKYKINKDGSVEELPIEVKELKDIPAFRYCQMINGDYRKMNLNYTGNYRLTKERKNKVNDDKKSKKALELEMTLEGTPFKFCYYVQNYKEKTLKDDLKQLKDRLSGHLRLAKPSVIPVAKAPIIKVDKKNKTVRFVMEENKFMESAKPGSKSKGPKPKQLNISKKAVSGGLKAYTKEEKAACLTPKVNASTNMGEQIAWALMTGQTPIYLNYNVSFDDIFNAVREANWQNQLILENDNINCTAYKEKSGGYRLEVKYLVSDINQRKKMQREMMSKGKAIVADIKSRYTDPKTIDIVYDINNYLIDHVEYDQYTCDYKVSGTTSRMAYGPLLEGQGVCSAYARAFQFLIQLAGFDCMVDGGDSSAGPHAWNLVRTGGNNYYMVDVTWNDTDWCKNQWMMIPDRAARVDHYTDTESYIPRYWTVNRPRTDWSWDYLRDTGRSVSINKLASTLSSYAYRGYSPTWLRVYDLHENQDKIESEFNHFRDLGFTTGYDWSYKSSFTGIMDINLYDYERLNKGVFEAFLE